MNHSDTDPHDDRLSPAFRARFLARRRNRRARHDCGGRRSCRSRRSRNAWRRAPASSGSPEPPAARLSASQCSGCPSVRLSFNARTRYFIGRELVTYTKLREAAAKGDDLRLDLFYEPKTRNLTRLRLAAAGNDK